MFGSNYYSVCVEVVLFISVIINVCFGLNEIPDFMKICHQSDPNVNECLKSAVEELRPQLQNGNPEYNIPSVEPIIMNDLIKESAGPLNLQIKQAKAYGGSTFEIYDITPDYNKFTFDVNLNIPELTIDARYRVDGKLMMIPIRGEGDFAGNLTNCKAHAILHIAKVDRDGRIFANIDKLSIKVTVGGGRVQVDHLFNGDKTLTKMLNDAINDNLQLFFADLLPYVEKALAESFIVTGNNIISRYTFDQLFPA